ncbi:MAG: Rho termination factor N-terminal domain-containing protein [Actinobacteria bacterium]|nr:Rho termination factor N-terminal domain-containing protein [Actinomycetota bacterium]
MHAVWIVVSSRKRRNDVAEVSESDCKATEAAKRNVKRAQEAAKRKRTIANLPEATRRGLAEQARKGRERGGRPGHALEDRNREQLYEIAREMDLRGRSKMGKWELIDAIRAAR